MYMALVFISAMCPQLIMENSWKGIHLVFLEHLVHLAGVEPELIVEVTIAQ